MTTSEKTNLIKKNSLCWVGALILPLILHFGLSSTKFPATSSNYGRFPSQSVQRKSA